MRAVGRLVFDCRVPPRIIVDHGIGSGEGEAGTARFEADEKQLHRA